MTITEHVNNLTVRQNTPYKYHGDLGMGYWWYNGEPISDEEMEALHPIKTKPVPFNKQAKGPNPDSTSLA